jgi:hydrogenase nickel incorporation protein HypB
MGRFHHHADGTVHTHAHDDDHDHPHDVGDHGGYATGPERVMVLERILAENDRVAAENRAVLAEAGVRCVNLMSAPGAGKTTLLRRTLAALHGLVRVGVLEGDIETSIDADAVREHAVDIALVNTSAGFGGECHLDAVMVRSGLSRLALRDLDLLVIENVGNLVCPAEFDVGADARISRQILQVTRPVTSGSPNVSARRTFVTTAMPTPSCWATMSWPPAMVNTTRNVRAPIPIAVRTGRSLGWSSK